MSDKDIFFLFQNNHVPHKFKLLVSTFLLESTCQNSKKIEFRQVLSWIQIIALPIVYSLIAFAAVMRMWQIVGDQWGTTIKTFSFQGREHFVFRVYEADYQIADLYEAWATLPAMPWLHNIAYIVLSLYNGQKRATMIRDKRIGIMKLDGAYHRPVLCNPAQGKDD